MSPMSAEQTFIQAYDHYADAIFRFCYCRVYDRGIAQELMQETFTKTWEQVANGKKIRNLRAFLYTTARHLVIDYSRKKSASSLDELREKGFDPGKDDTHMRDSHLDGKEALHTLEQLDEPYLEAVLLRYVYDLKPREIAEITGESTNIISVRINRGIRQLRRVLTNESND